MGGSRTQNKGKNAQTKRSSASSLSSRARRPNSKMSYVYDPGVPEGLLFHGILPGRSPGTKRVTLRVNAATAPSPFLIRLDALPTPQQIVEEQGLRIQLNFLVPEEELVARAPAAIDANILRVNADDLVGQLEENDRTETLASPSPVRTSHDVAPRALPPLTLPRVVLPSVGDIKRAFDLFQAAQPVTEITPEVIDLTRLVPKRPTLISVDAATFAADESSLSLPDAEDGEEDESELLTLEDLARLAVPTEPTEEPDRPSMIAGWKERMASFRLRMPTFTIPRLVQFELPSGWHRAVATFALASFAFVLPIQALGMIQELKTAAVDIRASGLGGLADLQDAASAVLTRDVGTAQDSFARAQKQFDAAKHSLDTLPTTASLLLSTLPNTRGSYEAGRHLVNAGALFARAGERLTTGLEALDAPAATPTSKLAVLSSALSSALPDLLEAEAELQAVDPEAIPEEQRATFTELQSTLPTILAAVAEINAFADTAATILGADGQKRYLVLFQNNTELRPTGGFTGSFAVVDVRDGVIENMEIPGGGTYDLQGSLTSYVAAPQPLQLLNARWEFQDANWFADFPTSARQALEFYADSRGPSVDGVIAVNATFVSSLLAILGPVEMPEYERTIDAENFLFETQKIVEHEFDDYADPDDEREEDAPKAFIGDLGIELLARANTLDHESALSVIEQMNDGLARKDIQIYFSDNELQREILERGWGGEVKTTGGDYLLIVDTNLGGGKTDGVIEQDVDLHVDIAEDGTIINTVTIARTHHGIANALFTGVNNVDYLRVYVPRGSELLAADGFTIPDDSLFDEPEDWWAIDPEVLAFETLAVTDPTSGTVVGEEFGKTVFGNWVQTKPGSTSTVTFRYRLPFTIQMLANDPSFFGELGSQLGWHPTESYTLMLQSQSGVLDRDVQVQVEAPQPLNSIWRSEEGESVTIPMDRDVLYSILFERAS